MLSFSSLGFENDGWGYRGTPAFWETKSCGVDAGGGIRLISPGQTMTTANKVTIGRILLIPFFVVEVLYYRNTGNEVHRLFAMLAFAVAAICDGVDGYIARRYNQRSELGSILDPLADKLLLVSGIVLCSLNNSRLGTMPLWLTGTVIGRDLLLLIGLVVIQVTVGKIHVHPRLLGKAATVLQMLCVFWILLKWDNCLPHFWFSIWTIGAAASTGISGLLYLLDWVRQLNSHPASSPAVKQ
jgi:CDP-diacylglycerol--glycerol-3-phosphate 3-phosphatidyltransferase